MYVHQFSVLGDDRGMSDSYNLYTCKLLHIIYPGQSTHNTFTSIWSVYIYSLGRGFEIFLNLLLLISFIHAKCRYYIQCTNNLIHSIYSFRGKHSIISSILTWDTSNKDLPQYLLDQEVLKNFKNFWVPKVHCSTNFAPRDGEYQKLPLTPRTPYCLSIRAKITGPLALRVNF